MKVLKVRTYTSKKGQITLIVTWNNKYEIACISGDLFEGVQRYKTLRKAKEVITKYLKE